jgi:hypothetical protein
MAIIDDFKKNSFSHKPSKHQKDLTDGLKLKPMFNHLWTKSFIFTGTATSNANQQQKR